ncbi:ER oxidoreductin SCDLUD_001311 [Saccharomycodes ludwigii]|uniref:ER oxidoreductin n=1 Tax=Saccharomycodes ludwigii TaxID=36035 RepID=UPI001E89122F|nr:hypothetical protein SCDLUD_001311 [Saccharomycodes ludwigii]KAH3903663.1 hypothetical protein SCDLUD_001311 [Saccharomycodes ludwigii]
MNMKILNKSVVLLSLLPFLTLVSASENVTANDTEVTDESKNNFCRIDKDENVGATCDITFKEINEINGKIRPELLNIVHSDFFKYFKLDLYSQCPFWNDNNGYCVNRACAVDVIEDWDKLPSYWQPEVLGELDKSGSEETSLDTQDEFLNHLCDNKGPNKNIRATTNTNNYGLVGKQDIEYCDVDEFSKKTAALVDLTANPERFTGYGGEQSSLIWSSIYKENCFIDNKNKNDTSDNQCLAKKVFFRLISGLHASIAVHLSNDYLNTETGKWGPNLELFMARVGNFPERVANIYFNYAIVSKAIYKISPFLENLDFCNDYDEKTKERIMHIASNLNTKIFNEDLLFQDDLTSEFKDQFRSRFKNVTRIMDCVHCDRCRLWGKVQTTGYATSLKILFEMDDQDASSVVNNLTKYELIALFNTFDRISQSVQSINNFEKLYYKKINSNNVFANLFSKNNFFKMLQSFVSNVSNKSEKVLVNTGANTVNTRDDKDVTPADAFKDIKMPATKNRKPTSENNIKNRWHQAFETEWHNYKEAVRFILRSYADLPRNVYNIIVRKVSSIWNSFVGVDNYLPVQDSNPNVYTLDFH